MKRRQILIGCPHYQRLVRGTYACGPDGDYDLAPDGSFLLERAECSHQAGRCAQTLCVLHRYNRGGPGSWYPSRLLAVGSPKAETRPGQPTSPQPPPRQLQFSATDVLR